MTVETDLYSALGSLVSNRVYPDIAPQGVAKPYITYQQVGGRAIAFLETAVVGRRNARIQVNVWHTSRLAANTLARSVEDALIVSTALRAVPLGSLVSTHEPDTGGLFGTRQDFSVWHTT
jgi:hypothetical protein